MPDLTTYEHNGRLYYNDEGRYQRPGWQGIAWILVGPVMVDDEDTEWTGLQRRTGEHIIRMVGDDRDFIIDDTELSDLVLLDDEDYCPSCGQIGCKAGAR